MTRDEADKLERWGIQLDDLDLRMRRLRERILECLCTDKDLTSDEETEIKRHLGVLKRLPHSTPC